jgi:DNA helicase-2/ATP-dependent DNA helicase PcrA
LFRTNEQTRPFELELRKAGLPYVVVGGYSFYDRKEVKDIVALIELAIDPENEPALRRMINVPPRGLGPKAVEILSGGAAERGMSLWKALHLPAEAMPLAPSAWRGARALCDMLDRAQAALQTAPGKLADAVASLVQISRYREEIERLYDDPIQRDARWANVEQIVNSAALYAEQHATGSARDFLDQLLLKQQDSEDEKERSLQRNAVVLITLHSAKGLEFPEVYLAGLEEGILPHHRSISSGPSAVEEERRLCYVGVTRAQQRLTLALALGRMKWGKRRATIPSRFLFELCGKTGNPKYRAAIEGLAPDAQKKPAAGKTKSNTDPR